MRKVVLSLVMLVLLAGTANAALQDLGDGTILDTTNNQLWQPIDNFLGQTYDELINSISLLGNGWHMASYAEMAALWTYSADELFDHFYYGSNWIFGGTYNEIYNSEYHYAARIYLDSGVPVKHDLHATLAWDPGAHPWYGAMVTKTPTPIPGAVWLLGTGLLGLVGLRKKFKG